MVVVGMRSGSSGSFGWKDSLAAVASALLGSVGSLPGDFGPVLEREKMMVTPCEVSAQYQGEFADGTSGRQGAYFAVAPGAKVAATCGA